MPRPIELLAPARDLECGLEAVRHGADAVYIGAPRFGARAAAGNSVEDIATLVRYAHTFGVRIYVTLNTLLYDDELPAAQALIDQLAAIHVDALITQDPRIIYYPPTSHEPHEPSESPEPPEPHESPEPLASYPSHEPPASHPSHEPLAPPASSASYPSSASFASSASSTSPASPTSHSILSPLPLHSSTQMDNRTVADVRARLASGYKQTVLARELSLDAIRSIHAAVPDMPLEVFVHGALCVSYSGRCYASEHCFGRSANRGECAQFCRLPFDLLDADGRPVTVPEGSPEGLSPAPLSPAPLSSRSPAFPSLSPLSSRSPASPSLSPLSPRSPASPSLTRLHQRHLLSLRDMNRAADLEALMDAGVTSFKIEGRLKDVAYVKNTTAYYRQRIDAILARRSADYCRSSYGTSTFTFTPDVNKSFNRRFTDYFLHGRTPDMACFATPKAIGEPVGYVKAPSLSSRGGEKRPSNYFEVLPLAADSAGGIPPRRSKSPSPLREEAVVKATFSNGDGLCFFDADGRLQGFRINRVDEQGRLYPADPSILASLRKGTPLYRNYDAAFERLLARPSADRRIRVRWLLEEAGRDVFRLTLTTLSPFPRQGEGLTSLENYEQPAPLSDGREQSVGLFPYPFERARTPQADNIRRQLARLGDTPYTTTDADITISLSDNWFIPSSVLGEWRRKVCKTPDSPPALPVREGAITFEDSKADACSEHSAPSLTGRAGGESSRGESAESGVPLMTCRYCLRHALSFCPRDHAVAARTAPRLPWSLRLADGRTFPLHFDCQRCEMQVLSEAKAHN